MTALGRIGTRREPTQSGYWQISDVSEIGEYYMYRIIILILLAGISFSSYALSPDDLRPKPYVSSVPMDTKKERLKLITLIKGATDSYIEALNAANYQSFKGLNIPPEHIASLTNELSDTKLMMGSFKRTLSLLQKDPMDTKSWAVLLREYYLVANYIEDLSVNRIVNSNDYIALRLFLPIVIDRIIIPESSKH